MPTPLSSARLTFVAAAVLITCSTHAFCQADPFDYVPNLPYTAEYVATSLETQADGAQVQRQWRSIESRDSQGRTWSQSFQYLDESQPISTDLFIPLRRQQIKLFGKMARVYTWPGTGPIARKSPPPDAVKEELPGQMIRGIYAVGTRTTWVRPQVDGSGSHYMDVMETWTSPDLKIEVLSKFTSTYPGGSPTTREIVRLDRKEPDAALFEIPTDYKIVDATLK